MEPVTILFIRVEERTVEESLEATLRRQLIRLENREREPVSFDPTGRTEADVLRSLLEKGTWVSPKKDGESGEHGK